MFILSTLPALPLCVHILALHILHFSQYSSGSNAIPSQ